MKTWRDLTVILLILIFGAAGCKEDPIPETEEEAPALTQKVNEFIETAMKDVYLWYKQLPDIDIRYEFDSEAYFEKLLYADDKWSFVTDDIQSFENSLEGKEVTFGYSLAFGRFSNTGNIFALVEFVYPNSPASVAGLKRGDIIVMMNNADITDQNYKDLLYRENISVTMGVLSNNGISLGETKNMTAKELNLNPVLLKKVIDYNDHKIGYLFYAQFISEFNSSLDSAFQYFKDSQITDLVIDLRYNPGGYISAAQRLCSCIAPVSIVNNNSSLVTFQWNDKYQDYWESNNVTSQLKVNFVNTVPVKLGLDKIYVLTGSGTASASELSITGLKPYMDVTTVGETTYGKYTASITLKPEDYYDNQNYYSDFDNWGLQPIVLRYANSQGVTDFKDGFTPDIAVDDDIWGAISLGDIHEPLFKAAVEDITGSQVIALKSNKTMSPFTIFDRGFSKFDRNKREVIFDNFQPDLIK